MDKNKLAYYRRKKGLSQRALGELVGVTGGYISTLETGKNKLEGDILTRLSNALGVPPEAFEADRYDPTRELVETLTALTEQGKMSWEIVEAQKLESAPVSCIASSGADFTVYRSNSALDAIYFVPCYANELEPLINLNASLPIHEELPLYTVGLYLTDEGDPDNQTTIIDKATVNTMDKSFLSKFIEAVQTSANEKSFIMDYLKDAKNLLGED